MAGEWLKIECSTPDKPEVLALTVKLGWDDPDLTVGKLFRLWRWFDQQTTDGNALGVTPTLLDKLIGVTGFVQAVAEVGWLLITDAGVSLSKFDSHNGTTAKGRAQTAKRVANHRSNGDCNASAVTVALAREEKRREERKTIAPNAVAFDAATGHFQVPDILNANWASAYPAVNIDVELSRASSWLIANPRNAKSNYARFLTNWLTKAQDKAPRLGGGSTTASVFEGAR